MMTKKKATSPKKKPQENKKATEAVVEAQEYLAGWQRARAELDNYRKRVQLEQAEREEKTQASLAKPLLELADTFQNMLVATPSDLRDHNWVQGVQQVGRQLEKLLVDFGIEQIEADGKEFDPQYHEAITEVQNTETPPGSVVEVMQTGYVIGKTIIRPAKVVVAAQTETS